MTEATFAASDGRALLGRWAFLTLYREHAPQHLDLRALPLRGPLELRRGSEKAGLADIAQLSDPHVSTRHARLAPSPDGVVVEDLESKNGVWVDGQRVSRAWLREGALLRVGRTLLQLVSVEAARGSAVERRFGLVCGAALAPLWAAGSAGGAGRHWLLWGERGCGKRSAARGLAHGLAQPAFTEFDALRIPNQLREVELLGNNRVRGAVAAAARGILYISRPDQLAARLVPLLFEKAASTKTTLVFGLSEAASPLADCARAAGAAEFELPALRQRVVEIPALVHSVLPRGVINVSVEFVEACCLEAWPGNISQLVRCTRDALARAVAQREGTLSKRHLSVGGWP